MAKGDRDRVQNQNQYQTGLSQNHLDNLRNNAMPQNQDLQNRAQVAYDQGNRDYSGIQSGLQNYTQNAYNRDLTGMALDRNSYGAYPGFQNFADTGGYSAQDIAAMRARGEGAVTSTFDAAKRKLEQENRIQGGSSTARTAALAKLTRDTARQVGETDTNLEAQLASDIRAGKEFGLTGMNNTDQYRVGAGVGANNSTMQQAMAGLQGQTSLYGTKPGMASMYGDLLNQSNGQLINIQQLQQQLAQLAMNGQLDLSKVPGNYQQALGNIGGTINLGSQVAGLFT